MMDSNGILNLAAILIVAFGLLIVFAIGLIVTFKKVRRVIEKDSYITKSQAEEIKEQNQAINVKFAQLNKTSR